MKTLYFDCFAGASGDMILGAMVAAGVDQHALKQQLELLSIQGFEIDFATVDRSGISATYAHVHCVEQRTHRHLGDILEIINASHLSDAVKERAAKIIGASDAAVVGSSAASQRPGQVCRRISAGASAAHTARSGIGSTSHDALRHGPARMTGSRDRKLRVEL